MKKNRTILVVDDDHTMLKVLEKQLSVAGHKIVGNLSGPGALERIKAQHPDLIILDLMMKKLSGVEVARALLANEDTQKIPMIFISATLGVEVDKGDETIEIENQKFPIFAKPLHFPKILSVIRKQLNIVEQNELKSKSEEP